MNDILAALKGMAEFPFISMGVGFPSLFSKLQSNLNVTKKKHQYFAVM